MGSPRNIVIGDFFLALRVREFEFRRKGVGGKALGMFCSGFGLGIRFRCRVRG